MWGFESLLPCQIRKGGAGRRFRGEAAGEMAEAAKLNREETGGESSFSVPGSVGKFGGKIAGYPRRLRSFLHDVRVEMRQVNWPSRDDVRSTTVVVTVTVAFFGVFFFLVDSGFGYLIQRVLKYFK